MVIVVTEKTPITIILFKYNPLILVVEISNTVTF